MAISVLGKGALVTGAGSGINLSFARLLLSRGCNVVFADLTLRPEARDLVDAYSSRAPGNAKGTSSRPQAVFHRTDVSSWADLSSAFETTRVLFGEVDIVCAGAGVFEPSWSSFWRPPGTADEKVAGVVDSATGDRYKSLDINLTHPIRLTQLAIMDHLKSLRAKKGEAHPAPATKTIIHVSSVNGQVSPLWTPLYNASKHAINGFVRTMAPLETRLGIRVAAVAPGLVKTPLWSDNEQKSQPLSADPAWVTPEEVAEVMLALAERDEVSSSIRRDGDKGMETETETDMISIAGGSILEVSGNSVRDVKAFFDPGPQGISPEDFDVSKMEDGVFEGLDKLG